jgi:predicted nucleic acid-binding protein
MLCLDTYALVELRNSNPKFEHILSQDFIIPDVTMAEFYWVLLREENKSVAYAWYRKFRPFCIHTDLAVLITAMEFRSQNRKLNMSFFDCAGYKTAERHGAKFVTGDSAFKGMKNVEFISA